MSLLPPSWPRCPSGRVKRSSSWPVPQRATVLSTDAGGSGWGCRDPRWTMGPPPAGGLNRRCGSCGRQRGTRVPSGLTRSPASALAPSEALRVEGAGGSLGAGGGNLGAHRADERSDGPMMRFPSLPQTSLPNGPRPPLERLAAWPRSPEGSLRSRESGPGRHLAHQPGLSAG